MSKKWEEISDMLTEKAIEELKVNTIMKFDQEDGSVREFKVRRKNKDGKVYVEELELMDPSEIKIKGNLPGKHFGHILDVSEDEMGIWCQDCNELVEEE